MIYTNNVISDLVLNKIIRKKEIWANVKVKENEYSRLQKQIAELETAKTNISFEVRKLMDESQQIAEWLDELEYEALKKENK